MTVSMCISASAESCPTIVMSNLPPISIVVRFLNTWEYERKLTKIRRIAKALFILSTHSFSSGKNQTYQKVLNPPQISLNCDYDACDVHDSSKIMYIIIIKPVKVQTFIY